MGGEFAGAFAYADDLKILSPSAGALIKMASICERYADKFDVLFNAKKSMVIVYKCGLRQVPEPSVFIKGARINCVNKVIHLGHLLKDNVYNFDISKCVGDFNRQCNMFLADFRYASCFMRNVLFHKYCTSFYGSQILPLFDNHIQGLMTAWRVAIRRVWRIPWHTHCNLLPHIAGVMDPQLWLVKRCIKFINMCINSDNVIVRTISNMGCNSAYSILGCNYRYLKMKYDMDVKNVFYKWNEICDVNTEVIRISEQVKELVHMRDSCYKNSQFCRTECDDMINFLCTGEG